MKRFILIPFLALALLASGCKTASISPALVQQGVATGVSYSVGKYPEAVPYLRAVAPIICSAANGTNLAPAEVVAAIESSNATVLKTPEGVLILNAALTLYVGLWNAGDAVNNVPTFKLYLQATCQGITDGLPDVSGVVRRASHVSPVEWPLVKLP